MATSSRRQRAGAPVGACGAASLLLLLLGPICCSSTTTTAESPLTRKEHLPPLYEPGTPGGMSLRTGDTHPSFGKVGKRMYQSRSSAAAVDVRHGLYDVCCLFSACSARHHSTQDTRTELPFVGRRVISLPRHTHVVSLCVL